MPTSKREQVSAQLSWPIGGGAVGALIRGLDWSSSAAGQPEDWDPALRGALDLFLPATAPMVLFWGDAHLAFYNDAYAPMVGDAHPQALGQPAERYWTEYWSGLRPLLDEMQRTGETYSASDRPMLINREGRVEEVFFDVSCSPVRRADGSVGGMLAIVKDTTAYLRAIEQLDLAQEAGGAGVFEWYLDNDEVAVSDGYRRLLGMEPGAPISLPELLDHVHPDDVERRVSNGDYSEVDPTPYHEYRIRRTDTGEERWLSSRGAMAPSPGGRRRMVGVVADITERKRAEEALVRLNETLEARVAEQTRERERIWRNSRDLMVLVGADGVTRAANPACTALLGFQPEELVGRNFRDFIPLEDVEHTQEALTLAVASLPLSNFESRFRTKGGSVKIISWHTSTEDGVVYGYGRDVTEEKAAAEALARTEEQLRQAQKMEAVGQLTGGIAHDFNNLLQGITGSLDLMRKRISEGRVADLDRFINGAMSSAERASALTHRLLAFSRRQPLDPRPVKVNPLMAGMEDLLRRTLGEGVDLELVLAGGLWMTICDANQLENALLNLAINARDAMPGGGKLIIETSNTHLDGAYVAHDRELKAGQYVCISVSDTGSGMDPEVMSRAFDPFFTTKPIGQGTGLGLSMIYGFARQSEGSVKLYSEFGRGTTVKLYLPRFRGPAPDHPSAEGGEAGHTDEGVLVVEDDAIVRSLIVEVLAEFGYRAIEASDGVEGLRILRSDRRLDLLVTDIGLPGMNGRQMSEAARAVRPGLKILFMTGYAENAALASGFLAPGMEMITKPFAMDVFARRVAEMMNKP